MTVNTDFYNFSLLPDRAQWLLVYWTKLPRYFLTEKQLTNQYFLQQKISLPVESIYCNCAL